MWWTTEACPNVLSSHSSNPFPSRPTPYSVCHPRLACRVTTCRQSTYFEAATSQLLGAAMRHGKQTVKKVLLKCRICRRYQGPTYNMPPMPDLPPERVTPSPPFTYTGVDYFGRLYWSDRSGNGKVWVVLVTCLAVRAIHLDLVLDLTADKIASRSGAPRPPLTDVGTETAFRLDQRKHFRKSKHLLRSEVS